MPIASNIEQLRESTATLWEEGTSQTIAEILVGWDLRLIATSWWMRNKHGYQQHVGITYDLYDSDGNHILLAARSTVLNPEIMEMILRQCREWKWTAPFINPDPKVHGKDVDPTNCFAGLEGME